MNEARLSATRRMIRVGDALLLVVAMLAAYFAHDALVGRVPGLRATVPARTFVLVGAFSLPIWLVVIALGGHDRFLERRSSRLSVIGGVVRTQLLGAALLLGTLWATQANVNRSVIGLFLVLSGGLLSVERLVLRHWAHRQYVTGYGRQRVILVGDLANVRRSKELLDGSSDPARGAHDAYEPLVVGAVVADQAEVRCAPDEILVLGDVEQWDAILHEHAVDRALFSAPFARLERAARLVESCAERGIATSFVLPPDETGKREPRIELVFGIPTVTYDPLPKRGELLIGKQLVDIVTSALGILALAPLLLCVGLLIWVTSGRPILFAQERIGQNGRRFRMLKFRTMARDAEAQRPALEAHNEMGGPAFKMARDPRVTRIGAILRRTSVDELPQLFNVLGGAMSLVGPRPLPVAEQQKIHGPLRRRLAMKPGITGLWQVSGRSDTSFEQWMRLDLEYVDRWTPRLDLTILLKTIPAVLFGRGAR